MTDPRRVPTPTHTAALTGDGVPDAASESFIRRAGRTLSPQQLARASLAVAVPTATFHGSVERMLSRLKLNDRAAVRARHYGALPELVTCTDLMAIVPQMFAASLATRYAVRVWDANSEGIQNFGGIDAYPYNPDWIVDAQFEAKPGMTMPFEHSRDAINPFAHGNRGAIVQDHYRVRLNFRNGFNQRNLLSGQVKILAVVTFGLFKGR